MINPQQMKNMFCSVCSYWSLHYTSSQFSWERWKTPWTVLTWEKMWPKY